MPEVMIGQMVHYVVPWDEVKGAHRPAVITSVGDTQWSLVGLHVFSDWDDEPTTNGPTVGVNLASIYDLGHRAGTWHELGPCTFTDLEAFPHLDAPLEPITPNLQVIM